MMETMDAEWYEAEEEMNAWLEARLKHDIGGRPTAKV